LYYSISFFGVKIGVKLLYFLKEKRLKAFNFYSDNGNLIKIVDFLRVAVYNTHDLIMEGMVDGFYNS